MSRRDESVVWITVGCVGALALGAALIPLRTVTAASNLAFVFLAFTIVVAELGGRSAALLTALVSAMSLNFFLTEPYLTLAISKPDDVVAFVALAACGLIAAAFGKRRERWSDMAERAGQELHILQNLVEHLRAGRPLDSILRDLTRAFRLGAMVLRDGNDRIVAAVPAEAFPASLPVTPLTADTLFPSDDARLRFGVRGLRLPEGGGRLRFQTDRGVVSLDLLEGDAQGFSLDESRTLAIAASILTLSQTRRARETADTSSRP